MAGAGAGERRRAAAGDRASLAAGDGDAAGGEGLAGVGAVDVGGVRRVARVLAEAPLCARRLEQHDADGADR